jgi:hypothetical protein
MVWCLVFCVLGLGFCIMGLGCRVKGAGFQNSDKEV